MARGPIRIPIATREEIDAGIPVLEETIPDDVLLPLADILDAGVKKFQELAQLHWPDGKESYKSISFDSRNKVMLRITLGLVYMAMRRVEDDHEASTQ